MSYAKTAFVVGVMFTFGKYVGGELAGATEMFVRGVLRNSAANGNEFAQKVCKNVGMNVESKQNTEDTVIGFKVN